MKDVFMKYKWIMEILFIMLMFYYMNFIKISNISIYLLLILVIILYKYTHDFNNNKNITIMSFIFSLIFTIGNLNIPKSIFGELIILIIEFIGWYFLLRRLFYLLEKNYSKINIDSHNNKISSKKFILISMILGFLLFIPYLLNYYPAVMSHDSYKQLSKRVRDNSANIEEMQMHSLYTVVNSIEEANDLYKERLDYIIYSIDSVDHFLKLPIIGKIIEIKNLSEVENCYLSKITELHVRDLALYNMEINEDLIFSIYDNFMSNIEKTNLLMEESTVAATIAGFMQSIYISESAQVYTTICTINKILFENIDNIKEVIEIEGENVENLESMYNEDKDRFNECCLFDNDLLLDVVFFYCEVRRHNLLNGKVLKNERHE